jgi:hypothetical protein
MASVAAQRIQKKRFEMDQNELWRKKRVRALFFQSNETIDHLGSKLVWPESVRRTLSPSRRGDGRHPSSHYLLHYRKTVHKAGHELGHLKTHPLQMRASWRMPISGRE